MILEIRNFLCDRMSVKPSLGYRPVGYSVVVVGIWPSVPREPNGPLRRCVGHFADISSCERDRSSFEILTG
jgi:hypothetical protein